MRNCLILGAVVALLCFPVFAGGGDAGEEGGPEQAQAQAPAAETAPVTIQTDPTDHWGLVIKYVLPAMGVALVVGWFGKRQLGKNKAKKAAKD